MKRISQLTIEVNAAEIIAKHLRVTNIFDQMINVKGIHLEQKSKIMCYHICCHVIIIKKNYFHNAMGFSLYFKNKASLFHLSLPPKIVNFHIYSNIWSSCKILTKCQ